MSQGQANQIVQGEDIATEYQKIIFRVAIFGYRVEHEAPGSFIQAEVKALREECQRLYPEVLHVEEIMKKRDPLFLNNTCFLKRCYEMGIRIQLLIDKLELLRHNLQLYKNSIKTKYPFGCEWCSKSYETANGLERHKKKRGHDRPVVHQCPHCPNTFATMDLLDDHNESLHCEFRHN